MTLRVRAGSTYSSKEYKSTNDGEAIINKIKAGIMVQIISKILECVNLID